MRDTLRKSLRRERRTPENDSGPLPRNGSADSSSGPGRELRGKGGNAVLGRRHVYQELEDLNSDLYFEIENLNQEVEEAEYKYQYLARENLDLRAENELLRGRLGEAKNEVQLLKAENVRLKRELGEAKSPRTELNLRRRSWRIIHGVLQLNLNIGRKRRKTPPPPIILRDQR